MIEKAPICPHCKKETVKHDTPPWDGVGWGVPFLYICFNDECPLFVRGQKHLLENYGQVASYRYIVYPDTGKEDTIVAMNPMYLEKRLEAMKTKLEDDDLKE